MTIFAVPWEELDLEHVERFLANAGREPLTWEAKGTEVRPEHVTKHVGGFANATDGGYLLLGFELQDDGWRASGIEIDDPPVWVSHIVRTTLRPRPRIDVRDWDVFGKRAAVVRVDPVAEPPCVTNSGQLYERVSGETIPVRDPGDVRALYERGRTATEWAEANALRSLEAVAAGAMPSAVVNQALVTVLSVAPVGTARDIAAEVFAPKAVERIRGLVDALPPEPHFPEGGWQTERFTDVHSQQDAVVVETTPELVQMWRLRTAWDGSVAGLLRATPGAEVGRDQYILSDVLFDQIVRPLCLAIEAAARAIGGYGRAHVAFRPTGWAFGVRHGSPFPATRALPRTLRPIQRWAEDEPWLGDGLIESMKRELLRACGFLEWEPET